MRWLAKLRMSVKTLLRGRTEERQLDAELKLHLEYQIAQNIAAGMSATEAGTTLLAGAAMATNGQLRAGDRPQ